jgi:hypothetical protein
MVMMGGAESGAPEKSIGSFAAAAGCALKAGLRRPDGAADKISKAYENLRWVDCSVNEKLIFEELLLNIAGCSTI